MRLGFNGGLLLADAARQGDIFPPAAIGADQVSGCVIGVVGLDHFTQNAAGHDVTTFNGVAIGCALHPGAIGRIQRDVSCLDQNFAVARRRNGGCFQPEIVFRQFPLRNGREDELFHFIC